ncbi:MAG: type ISP restriction/modification enzyme [Planctomycetota bacterium]
MMLKTFLRRIFEVAKRGDATEESYYSCLEELLSNYAASIKRKQTHVTTIPKKTEAGNPDFRIWDGKQHIVGYIEAKAPTVEYLDQIETQDQLKRYLHTFPNLILTNFLEFRLYRNGILIDKVLIGRPYHIHKLKSAPPVEREEDFLNLLNKFFSFSLPKTYTAKSLAIELAKRTRFLKDQVVAEELREESEKDKGFILGFYQAFQTHLIGALTKDDFADLYSQTITYGLFAARTRAENGFNRKLAYDNIPHTIGILREIFKFISLGDLPPQMEWIVDDISNVLAAADVPKILHNFYHEGKGRDPIVHFYETFLAEYDPKEREKRGVYYTPEPVVSYIVRSLHNILKQRFDKEDGFATSTVTVLDPAAGTLTFLAEAGKLAIQEFTSKYGEAGKKDLIKEHILKNFYAFELMMAPYAVGHLKMSFLLEELGYKLQRGDRAKLYLTNTLEMLELWKLEHSEFRLPGMASLTDESRLAGEVKKEQPILVILGNPPYSGHSTNIGKWISKEIKVYYKVDDKPLGEKNPKWLQDDYVKFIRFAQWKIDQAGEGVLGFITNHSYLDNPTFRGMRQSLMKSFNDIYLLDLHGNSLKKEICPDGSKDENVFDIQQGVAIALFIKKRNVKERCKVYHHEKWGLRENKYDWLLKNDINTTKWKKLSPKTEFYFFIPRDEKLSKTYEKYLKVTDIFPVNSVGIVTSRDNFVIDFNKDFLKARIMEFRNKTVSDEIIRRSFNLKDKSNWRLKDKREKIMDDKDWAESVTKILYRPFDIRWIFYHDDVVERSRREVMQHMTHENLGLIVNRQIRMRKIQHSLVSEQIVDLHILETAHASAYVFPLYLYPERNNPKKRSSSRTMMLFEPKADYNLKKPNLSKDLLEQLAISFKKEPIPEQIFFYIYAVLYSNIYRAKYAEFLKIDFPRIPFTKDFKLFQKVSDLGKELTDLHLLKSKSLSNPVSKFQGDGTGIVEKPEYYEKEKKVLINKEQYFEGMEKEVWEYQIGGYQVCDKWLKDRKGKSLTLDDVRHYCKIVSALKKTIEIQKEIDKLYPKVEERLIEFEH